MWAVGDPAWLQDSKEAWIGATVAEASDTDVRVVAASGRAETVSLNRNKEAARLLPRSTAPREEHGVSDIDSLVHLHDASVLHAVRARFERDVIYTGSPGLLLAANPFKPLPLYAAETARRYHRADLSEVEPHCFAVAEDALRHMLSQGADQSIIICGESGAGKTETTKHMLEYLATVCLSAGGERVPGRGLAARILQSNPLLEAFGNAATARNHNSSRFGKLVKAHFAVGGQLAGASVTNYLLEKSRVVARPRGEQAFHVFYQLLGGAPEETKARLDLSGAKVQDFAYLAAPVRRGEEADSRSTADDEGGWAATQHAMDTIGMPPEEQQAHLRVLAAILHLGNVHFLAHDGDSACEVDGVAHLASAARLLRVGQDALAYAIGHKSLDAAGQRIYSPLTAAQARASRDALAKALYQRCFNALVHRVNASLAHEEAFSAVGILDMYGFENVDCNGFEQLFINYANERLQLLFNDSLFRQELEEYEAEGVPVPRLRVPDNTACVDLLDRRPHGLFWLLDEECLVSAGSDKNLLDKAERAHRDNPLFARAGPASGLPGTYDNQFLVRHFAGSLAYTCEGFVDKNRDTLHATISTCLTRSEDPFVRDLFSERADAVARRGSMGGGERGGQPAPSRKGKALQVTLARRFVGNMRALSEALAATRTLFVRCLKTSERLAPDDFHPPSVLRQLTYSGVSAALNMRRRGYPHRHAYQRCLELMLPLLDADTAVAMRARGADPRLLLSEVLRNPPLADIVPMDAVAFGTTKVFFRDGAWLDVERAVRAASDASAARIQAAVRGAKARRQYRASLAGVVRAQAFARMLLARKRIARARREARDARRRNEQRERLQWLRHLLDSAERGVEERPALVDASAVQRLVKRATRLLTDATVTAEGESVDEVEAAAGRAEAAVRAVGRRVALVETAAADHDRRWELVRKAEDRMARAAEAVAVSRSELAAIGLDDDESLRGPLQEALDAVDAARKESEAAVGASQHVLDTARAVVGAGPATEAQGEEEAAESREAAMEEAEKEAESALASLTAAADRAERVVRSTTAQVDAARSEHARVEEARRVAHTRLRAAQERLQAVISLSSVRRTCHAPTVKRWVAEARAAVDTSLAAVDAEQTADATMEKVEAVERAVHAAESAQEQANRELEAAAARAKHAGEAAREVEERLEALRERARAHGVGGNEEEGVREAVAATTSALAALHAASALDPEAMKWTEDGDAAAVWEDATARARVSEGAAKRAVARAEAAVENAIEADERERQAREEAATRLKPVAASLPGIASAAAARGLTEDRRVAHALATAEDSVSVASEQVAATAAPAYLAQNAAREAEERVRELEELCDEVEERVVQQEGRLQELASQAEDLTSRTEGAMHRARAARLGSVRRVRELEKKARRWLAQASSARQSAEVEALADAVASAGRAVDGLEEAVKEAGDARSEIEDARAEATARVADMTAQLDAVLSAVDQHRLRGDIELDRATALVSRSLATATDALDHEVWRLFDGDGGNEPFDLAAVGERADRALVQAEAALAAVDDALSAVERILGARQAREENRAQAERDQRVRSRREAEAAARRREQDEEARRGSARRVDDAEDTFSAAVSRLDAVKRELAADQRAAERDGRRRGWQAADAKQALDGWIAARKRGAEEEAGPSGPSSELTHRAPLAPDRLGKLAHHSVLSSLAAARARAEALGETARRTEASLDEARDVLRREDAAARCVQRGSAAAAAVEGFDAAVEVLDQERERVLSQGAERAQAAHAATEAEAMLQRLQQGLESNAGGDASSLALSEVPGIRRAMARAHTAVQGVVDAACAIESASDARGAGGEASAGDAQPQWRAETSGVEAAWQVFEEASALACDRVNVAVSQIEQEVGHREMRASLRRTVLDAEDSRQAVARRLGVARGRLSGLEAAVRAATEGNEVADAPWVAAALTKGRTALAAADRACKDLAAALTQAQARPWARDRGESQAVVPVEPGDRMVQCKQAADQAARAASLAEARLREAEHALEEETRLASARWRRTARRGRTVASAEKQIKERVLSYVRECEAQRSPQSLQLTSPGSRSNGAHALQRPVSTPIARERHHREVTSLAAGSRR